MEVPDRLELDKDEILTKLDQLSAAIRHNAKDLQTKVFEIEDMVKGLK